MLELWLIVSTIQGVGKAEKLREIKGEWGCKPAKVAIALALIAMLVVLLLPELAHFSPDPVTDDDFYPYESAIPEFPTVITAIVVAGLCFGIYYWTRKRRLGYATA